MKIIALSWHPGTTTVITAGGYTRFYEIVKRCPFELAIVDTYPSLYSPLKNKKLQIIEYGKHTKFSLLKRASPVLAKIINRILSIMQICFILYKNADKEDIIYVPYSELVELTIPAVIIKWIKGCRVVFCNLNVNTYLFDKPINIFLHQHADTVITLSNDLKQQLLASGIKKVDFVNGVGFDKPKIFTRKKVQKEYDAIFIGRHIPQKGITDLLNIWNILINKMNKKLILVTIGDIPDFIRPELERKINEYKLTEYIIMKGKVDDNEKQRLLLSSKTMVFPSRQEGWGIAPMEALSLGLPVVAYDLPVFKESIGNSKAFRTVSVGNTQNFSKTVIDTVNNASKYSSQATRWRQIFSWDRVAKMEWELIVSVSVP